MSAIPDFMREPHDSRDPNPWRAIYLDRSIPIADECKQAWLTDMSSRSRQFLLPVIRPLARSLIVLFQVLKIFIPRRCTSSALLHRVLEWNMRTWLSPQATLLIFRHFHLGSEILQFIARNTRGIQMAPTPLKPTRLDQIREHVYVQHDINLFNFVIEINQQLRDRNLELAPIDELDFSCISDGPPQLQQMPNRWTNSSTCRLPSSCTRRSTSCC